MGQQLKQSAALDTGSDRKVFFWARLKLTGVYLLVVTIIVTGFSLFLYHNLQSSLYEPNDGEFADAVSQQRFIEHTLSSFENDILVVDLIILIATGSLGYLFAGYTLRPIQNVLDAQQTFSEKASHELRTPLAVMRNDLEVLLRNPTLTKELTQKVLRSNIEEIDNLTSMTQDLLMLARSHTRSQSGVEQIDVSSIVKGTADKLKVLADNKGVFLKIVTTESVHIFGRKPELTRVLTNIVQNAVEHTPKGGSITIEVKHAGTQALVLVSDTGSGIDAKDLPHVFERFYKGEGTNGSGLGLSIVKEIIIQHGGEVSIESEKGKGTVVTIRLSCVG